ncbi:MAG: sugar phosphate nucleotidyltransferase [bacterium]
MLQYYFNNTGIVILAAGRGKRLGCKDIPKVLRKLNNRPIVSYILEELENNGIDKKQISLVVGFQKEKVKEAFGTDYIYAIQEELLGTAHAAHTGEKELNEEIEDFLIINSDDSAFYSYKTLENFVARHKSNNNDITLLTCYKDDPFGLGRIIRDEAGKVIAIREKENIREYERNIKEISTGTFCFRRNWFNEIYPKLKLIPNLGEFGLPSFIDEAIASDARFEAIKLANPNEWFGINTKEQLREADLLKRRLRSC